MTFQIGKIAKLLGMSSEGLRLYERIGILNPRRGKSNTTYRTYEHLDFTALIRARGYHYAGFSSKEIAALINAKQLQDVIAGYEAREKELEHEIWLKGLILENIRELKELTVKAEQNLGEITVCTQPAIYRFPFMKNGEFLLRANQEKAFRQWVSFTPIVFISQSNEWDKLMSGSGQITAALGVFEEQAERLKLDLQWASYYPSSRALYSIVQEQGDDFQPLSCLRPLMEYTNRNRIQVIGDPVSRTFLSMNKSETYTRYREVWLPYRNEGTDNC
ncbi:MerR family transcriptional regulator [Clostridium transplantifaecale]|uniref:MerR family transcriptional regulator n=1 Tax=Clostridium transplantifaecale TaxID=2479838 RepID=UPI000F63C28D|nr:MerR family transcriptional regulator [Clostridium transplantifaecale]